MPSSSSSSLSSSSKIPSSSSSALPSSLSLDYDYSILRRKKKLSLSIIATIFEKYITLKDRRYHLKVYKNCFIGYDAISLLYTILVNIYTTTSTTMEDNESSSLKDNTTSTTNTSTSMITRYHALLVGRELMKRYNLFQHVTKGQSLLLEDDYYFYKFIPLKYRRGVVVVENDDEAFFTNLFTKKEEEGEEGGGRRDDNRNNNKNEPEVYDEYAALEYMMHDVGSSSSSYTRGKRGSSFQSFSSFSSFGSHDDDDDDRDRRHEGKKCIRRILTAPGIILKNKISSTTTSITTTTRKNTTALLSKRSSSSSSSTSGVKSSFFRKQSAGSTSNTAAATTTTTTAFTQRSSSRSSNLDDEEEEDDKDKISDMVEGDTNTSDVDDDVDDDDVDDIINLRQIAESFEQCIEIKKIQWYHGKKYENIFIGTDAVNYLLSSHWALNRLEAVVIGQALQTEYNLFQHVSLKHKDFLDDYYFYQFTNPIERIGGLQTATTTTTTATSDENNLLLSDEKGKEREQQQHKLQQEQQQYTYQQLQTIAIALQSNIIVKNRKYHLRTYTNCFIGSDAVSYLVNANYVSTRLQACDLIRYQLTIVYPNFVEHVTKQHEFKDDIYFYRFTYSITELQQQPTTKSFLGGKKKDTTATANDNNSSSSKMMVKKELLQLANQFKKGVTVTTHMYHFKKYKKTFIGCEAVDYLVDSSIVTNRKEAVQLGQKLCIEFQLFHHVTHQHPFKDDYLFYRFTDDNDDNDDSRDDVDDAAGSSNNISNNNDSSSPSSLLELGGGKGKEEEEEEEESSIGKFKHIADDMRRDIQLKNRRWYHKVYKNTFLGTEVVDYLIRKGHATNRIEAIQLGRNITRICHLFEHVEGDHELKDERLFYHFLLPTTITTTKPDHHHPKMEGKEELNQLRTMANQFVQNVPVKDNRYRLRIYKQTFVGEDSVSYLVQSGMAQSREDAVRIGHLFMTIFHLFEHVTRDHNFQDKFYFYRIIPESERLLWNTTGDDDDDNNHDEDSSSEIRWKTKISEFGTKFSLRRRVHINSLAETTTPAERVRLWASEFRRRDPRYRILQFFNEVAQVGADEIETGGIDLEKIHPLLWFISRANVFTVWRPTALDAIRKMMLGQAVGKGLDIKGKSAKRGKLSAFVPFLQISENRHKHLVRTLPKTGRVRVYFSSQDSRDDVANKLELVQEEMVSTVTEAKEILTNKTADQESQEQAKELLLWDVDDPYVTVIDDFAPNTYGLDMPVRVFWEAFIMRQDCTRKPGSQYDSGRPSTPSFQDMNISALLSNPIKGNPQPVIYQNADDSSDAMNPFELLMAYQDPNRVLPVVSDFDAFLVGTRRVPFDPVKGSLPPDQLDILKWSIRQIEKILDGPTRPESWTNRWLEVLKNESRKGFHPMIPRFGFGDPRSYSIMENAIERLNYDGAVRHGAECFNYYFPQEVDDQFLVICDSLGTIPWKYMDPQELQDFLSNRIDDGYTFPLNPKWVLCDPGWKDMYDRLLLSEREEVQNSMTIWFPPESGVREQIEEIHSRNKNGFERGLREESSE